MLPQYAYLLGCTSEILKADCYLIVKITLYTKVQNEGERQRKNKNQILQERRGVLKKHEKVDLVK